MLTITNKEYAQLTTFIKEHYGIHLKEEKKTLVTGRLFNVLQQLNLTNFTDYYEYLISDRSGTALRTLVAKISTNHTFFMREADHFSFFNDQVLPYLSQRCKTKDLRIWSAGCSTGEEPYTLAMLIDAYFGGGKQGWDTNILATDISDQVLEIAAQGIYENERIAPLPTHWKSNYFMKRGSEKSEIIEAIKNQVTLRRFNLMDPIFPFKKKFQVIFCRNVMIYFDNQTKINLVRKFYDCLEPGGYLFIGHSETINREQSRFTYILPAVYRKE
jgi:chemotaxis protein methyltransferase CheR